MQNFFSAGDVMRLRIIVIKFDVRDVKQAL
jgi:hypothetical protein